MEIVSGACTVKVQDGNLLWVGEAAEVPDPRRPFLISVAGRHDGQSASMVSAQNRLAQEFALKEESVTEGVLRLMYEHGSLGLKVLVHIAPVGDSGCFRQTVSVENISDKTVTVTHLSGAFVNNIGTFGMRVGEGFDFAVHYFESTWEAEAVYRRKSAQECGFVPVSVHHMTKAFRIGGVGSYTTANYRPEVFLENTASGRVWFVTQECEGSWHMEISRSDAYDKAGGGFYIEASSLSLRHCAFMKTLGVGESFAVSPTLWGSASGSFDGAVAALTEARRALYKKAEAPLMFNDYMNCLWGAPTEQKLLPLIDTAAKVGAEGFCIDAGWYKCGRESWGNCLGDWTPGEEQFPTLGLGGVIAYIRSKGMTAGLWTELEVCGEQAHAYFDMPDDCFLCRGGKRVGGGERCFFNFTNRRVLEYLFGRVKALYDMGVRYLKNDYNDCIGGGADGGTVLAEMLTVNHRAAMAFYEDLQSRLPGLVIENCGSGGMRADYGTLRHFHLQSTSDQEIYWLYPAIAQGSLAAIVPEQAGIWSFPYPHLFDERGSQDALQASVGAMADGRQTAFNMVTGLSGVLYLSGRIDVADEKNLALISEGMKLYKNLRAFKRGAVPFYPDGLHDIFEPNGYVVLGLYNGDRKEALLYVWRLHGENEGVRADLRRFSPISSVDVLFPRDSGAKYSSEGNVLTVSLPAPLSAVILRVKFG